MKITLVSLENLKPYERNPRINDGAVEYVANSIKEFGFKVPIVIDRNNVIVAGHTRYKAAKTLGLEKVPCIVADDLNDEQIKAYRLADNKTAELAKWDTELLYEEISDIIDIDMSFLGFDLSIDEPKERKDLSDEVADVFEVVIECESEMEQEEIYTRLVGEGLKCRVLTL